MLEVIIISFSLQINQALAGATNGPYSATCLNINYSDSGLFGFYLVGQSKDMPTLLKAGAAQFGNATKVGCICEHSYAKTDLKISVIVISKECLAVISFDMTVTIVLYCGNATKVGFIDEL